MNKKNATNAPEAKKNKKTDNMTAIEIELSMADTNPQIEASEALFDDPYCPFEMTNSEVGEVEIKDAIWGSYTEAELEKLHSEAEILKTEIPEPEAIIGPDERIRIDAPKNTHPYRSICALRMTSANGNRYIGTGFLVAPRIVLTAGHCVFFHKDGGWARHIEVIPALDGNSRPYGSAVSSLFCSLKGWTKKKNWNYDFAIIVLPQHKALGNEVGWFGFCHYGNKKSYENKLVRSAGYPGDKGGNSLYTDYHTCTNENNLKLAYKIDTMPGQSGSPVGFTDSFTHAIAIHTNGGRKWNYGTKISRSILDLIREYKKNYPG